MPITEELRSFIQELIDLNIINASAVSNLPPGLSGAYQIIQALSSYVNEDAFLAHALGQNTRFYYIPGLVADTAFISKTYSPKTLNILNEVHQVLPLTKVGETIWCGILRTYPYEENRLEEILNSKQIACTVTTPLSYVKYLEQYMAAGCI